MTQLLKTLLLIFFFCSFSNFILAQKNSKRTAVIGFSYSSEFLSENLPKTTISNSVGLFYQYSSSEKISFSTNLYFANRNYIKKKTSFYSTGERSFYEKIEKNSAATIELNFKYHLSNISNNISYFLGLGVSGRITFKSHTLITEDFENPIFGFPIYDDSISRKIKRYTSYNFNVGFDYKHTNKIFIFTQMGLNVFQNDSFSKRFSIKDSRSNIYLKVGIGLIL